jgi:hypothetical protein
MHSSRAVNLSWKLTVPHALYSKRTQMWQIEEGLTAENYCGGYCIKTSQTITQLVILRTTDERNRT